MMSQTRKMGYGSEILSLGGVLPFDRARKIADIINGASNTMMVGEYKVVVTPVPQNIPPSADGMTFRESLSPPPVSNIPQSYRDLATTTLTATVQQGANDFKFDLEPRK